MAEDVFLFLIFCLIIPQAYKRFFRHRNQRDQVEDGHQTDTDITEIPDKGVGGQSADKHHDQGENLVRRLGGPGVSEEVAHIGAGVEEDADEGREAEQPQDYGYENDA